MKKIQIKKSVLFAILFSSTLLATACSSSNRDQSIAVNQSQTPSAQPTQSANPTTITIGYVKWALLPIVKERGNLEKALASQNIRRLTMAVTLTKPVWNLEYETQLLDRLVAQYAPNLPFVDRSETRPPQTAEETKHIAQYRIFAAAHDLFIVQAIAKAIGSIIDDLHTQLVLTRHLGDGSAHALDRVATSTTLGVGKCCPIC